MEMTTLCPFSGLDCPGTCTCGVGTVSRSAAVCPRPRLGATIARPSHAGVVEQCVATLAAGAPRRRCLGRPPRCSFLLCR